jgi:DNA (cytosine-5)-methyltransferase 1
MFMRNTNKSNEREPFGVVSLFSGAGGLDLGFKKAGFDITWSNEYDRTIWDTIETNFQHTQLDRRSIVDVPSADVPDCIGVIGGPPCQSWSEAGAKRGINDHRGQLFYEYIRILEDKKPLFFLAENVSGILSPRHKEAFDSILKQFDAIGYDISVKLVNAFHYGVPQDRKRVIIVGYRKDLGKHYEFPSEIPASRRKVLSDAIGLDSRKPLNTIEAKPALEKNYANLTSELLIPNHEYFIGGFSTMYMSRNRVRSYEEPSFTIQAGGRHAPIHPQAPKMKLIGRDKREFIKGKEHLYRRLSIRECARIQTFPDTHKFVYSRLADGYKMVGNAVPVQLAAKLAKRIYKDLFEDE